MAGKTATNKPDVVAEGHGAKINGGEPPAPAERVLGGRWDGAVLLGVEQLVPFEWNPNEMSPLEFNSLVQDIQEKGFDEPLQVVAKEGVYYILGGEHRWKACKVLGVNEVPCVVKDLPESEWKAYVVRRNIVRGELNRDKFTRLVRGVTQGDDYGALAQKMGFDDLKAFMSVLKVEKTDQRAADSILAQSERELDAVHNLSHVLNQVFAAYGDTLPQGYMFFAYGKKMHLLVQMDKELEEQVKTVAEKLQATGGNASAFFREALAGRA